jgi:hypothetical protein
VTLCVVCSRLNARPRHTAGGTSYGPTCDGECEVVAWDAHWQRATSTDAKVAKPQPAPVVRIGLPW